MRGGVLGIVPARSGSKGVPAKNERPLAGRTLVQRAIDGALASGAVDRLLVSTDSPRIAETARAAGAEVPELRPAGLAGDTTPMIDVVLHVLDRLAVDGYVPDAVLLLQPTSPLRTADHIRRAVELLTDGVDAVCSVVALPQDLCPHYVMRITEAGYLDYFLSDGRLYTRRQDVPLAYRRDGTIFLTRTPILRSARNFYGARCVPMLLDRGESLNIDTAEEWEHAERLLADERAPAPAA
jgi:CMP-N,N'-diacetyllegionaminic acid synthase